MEFHPSFLGLVTFNMRTMAISWNIVAKRPCEEFLFFLLHKEPLVYRATRILSAHGQNAIRLSAKVQWVNRRE